MKDLLSDDMFFVSVMQLEQLPFTRVFLIPFFLLCYQDHHLDSNRDFLSGYGF